MIITGCYKGNPFLGVFVRANDEFVVVPENTEAQFISSIVEAMEVTPLISNIMGSQLVGSLLAINSYGAVVSSYALSEEIEQLKKHLNVIVVKEKYNAMGNNLLVNDYGGVINKNVSNRNLKEISNALNVELFKMDIANLNTVGMAAVVTNRSMLCHPKVSEEESKKLKDIFKVPVTLTTANFGVAAVGTSIVANSKGAAVGDRTTPIEMMHIEDGLNPQ